MQLKKKAIGVLGGQSQGRKRQYNIVSEQKLRKMMELTYEVRSEAKIKWAVKAYRDWREMKLDDTECEEEIIFSDIDEVSMLTKERFEIALCRFIV